MKILGIYGSSHGQAESVLRRVLAELEAHGHLIEVHDGEELPRELRVREFDAVLVAASIIFGALLNFEWVKRHAG